MEKKYFELDSVQLEADGRVLMDGTASKTLDFSGGWGDDLVTYNGEVCDGWRTNDSGCSNSFRSCNDDINGSSCANARLCDNTSNQAGCTNVQNCNNGSNTRCRNDAVC